MVLSAQHTHLELAHSDKAIVVPMREIDKADGRAFALRLAVLADAGVFQQQSEDVTVVLKQACTGKLAVSCLTTSST